MYDTIVPPNLQEAQKVFYEHYGANISFDLEPNVHSYPVDYPFLDVWPRESCDGSAEEFRCNNGFDSAGKILSHLLTNIPATEMTSL